jgi:hypothetical protein
MPALAPSTRKPAAPRKRRRKAAKANSTRRTVKQPDMKAWAARVLARLKAQYGDRVTPDSTALFEDMRADRC